MRDGSQRKESGVIGLEVLSSFEVVQGTANSVSGGVHILVSLRPGLDTSFKELEFLKRLLCLNERFIRFGLEMTGDILRLIHFVSFRKELIEHAILHCNGLKMGLNWVTLHVHVSYLGPIGSGESRSRFKRLLCERCISFASTFSGIKVRHGDRFTSLKHCLRLRLSALVDRRNAICILGHTKLRLGHTSVVRINISLHGSLQRHSLLIVNSTDLLWESLHYSLIIILFFIQFMLINTCFGVQSIFEQVCLSIELSIDISSFMKVSLYKCVL